MPARESTKALAQAAAYAIIDKLGTNLVATDLSEQLVLNEMFLIASGANEPQVDAIADEVERKLAQLGEKPARREATNHWVLLDYSDLVVHIQTEEIRQYYMIDRLWNDCPTIELDAVKEDKIAKERQKKENSQ